MYVRIEAYDVLDHWRVTAHIIDTDGEPGADALVLDRSVDLHRLDADDTPEDVLASIASECSNLAYRRDL